MNTMNLMLYIVLLFRIINVESTRHFPRNISFGVGTSAYQIEGAWDKDGKSENVWDRWIHEDPSHIENNDTADIACDSYRIPEKDAYYVSILEVQHYSFSIPWSRILPTGFANVVNMKAITHYQTLIRYLLILDIVPVVTLYYYDLPQSLQDIGGWTNPAMAKYFAEYARVCFQYFSNVTRWLTFNDPEATCRKGYGMGTFAPGINSDGVGEYLCAYTILKAHAAAYHIYKEEFKDMNGTISMAIDMHWFEPSSSSDEEAAKRRNDFKFGLYANPIYKGNWPQEVIERVDYRSRKENFTKSRLPKFTDEEINYIKGTSDFMAINLFYTYMVQDTEEAEFGNPSFFNDMKSRAYFNSSWTLAVNKQPIVPQSARKTLAWLSSTYNNPEIFITASGIADNNNFNDSIRIKFLKGYLNAILDAIEEDEVKVIGYTVWSLYNSFEWTDGYSYQFGLYWIDSEGYNVTTKMSARFYENIARTRTIPEEEEDTSTTATDFTTDTIPDTTPGSAPIIVSCCSFVVILLFLLQILV